jgi:hypothetical protein
MRSISLARERPLVERELAHIHRSSVPVGDPENNAVSPIGCRSVPLQHDVVQAQEAQGHTELILGCLHGRRI